MGKGECSSSVLSRLDLDDIGEIVWEPYHKDGPGRPPRNPLGIFKALIVERLRHIPSDRELYKRLWNDPELRHICDIEEEARAYHPSQLTRFRKRVGPERLERIMNGIVEELVEGGVIKGEIVVLDATFIKAYSKRDPHDDSQGYSDPEARVGRSGKTYELGYKAHIAADSESEMPVAFIAAPANENEKRHADKILDKTLEATRGRVKMLVADSQYSSKRLREKISAHGVEAVIPYPANQRPRWRYPICRYPVSNRATSSVKACQYIARRKDFYAFSCLRSLPFQSSYETILLTNLLNLMTTSFLLSHNIAPSLYHYSIFLLSHFP